MLTEKEYQELINNIPNSEVPELIFSVLMKVHHYLEAKEDTFEESQIIRQGMFKLFFKQFNTVLTLSQSTSYLYKPEVKYLDIKSINIIIRSMHELYLAHQYLACNLVFDDIEEERDFKYAVFKFAGEIDSKRAFNLMKDINFKPEEFEQSKKSNLRRIDELWNRIRSMPPYETLDSKIKDKIKGGHWRVNAVNALSWNDLLDYSPMSKKYGVSEYHHLSQYAHMGYGSMVLEANHNKDIDGLLCYLYILATLLSVSVVDSYGDFIDKIGLLNKRELALVLEFVGLASKDDA